MASTGQQAGGNAGWDSAQAAAQASGYGLHPDYVARMARERLRALLAEASQLAYELEEPAAEDLIDAAAAAL